MPVKSVCLQTVRQFNNMIYDGFGTRHGISSNLQRKWRLKTLAGLPRTARDYRNGAPIKSLDKKTQVNSPS